MKMSSRIRKTAVRLSAVQVKRRTTCDNIYINTNTSAAMESDGELREIQRRMTALRMNIKPRTVYEFAWNDFILSPAFYWLLLLLQFSSSGPLPFACVSAARVPSSFFSLSRVHSEPSTRFHWPHGRMPGHRIEHSRTMSIDEVALINNYKKFYSRMFGFRFSLARSARPFPFRAPLSWLYQFDLHMRADAHTRTQPLKCLGKNSISFDSLRFQVISMGFFFYSFL